MEQDSNKLALGWRAKLVAHSQPMHKCILLMYLYVLLIHVDLSFLEVQHVGQSCLFVLRVEVKKRDDHMTGTESEVSFWNSSQITATFSFHLFSLCTFCFLGFYSLISLLTKGYIKSMATKRNQ